jgi:hypothetical protein
MTADKSRKDGWRAAEGAYDDVQVTPLGLRLLEAAAGLKYKTALGTAFGPGLRVLEVAGLKAVISTARAC